MFTRILKDLNFRSCIVGLIIDKSWSFNWIQNQEVQSLRMSNFSMLSIFTFLPTYFLDYMYIFHVLDPFLEICSLERRQFSEYRLCKKCFRKKLPVRMGIDTDFTMGMDDLITSTLYTKSPKLPYKVNKTDKVGNMIVW